MDAEKVQQRLKASQEAISKLKDEAKPHFQAINETGKVIITLGNIFAD